MLPLSLVFIMPVISVDSKNRVLVSNGVAYSLIAGGATGYLDPNYRWYTGKHYTYYMLVLTAAGVPLWMIASLLAIRAAISEAANSHADEIPNLVEGTNVRLIAAETMDDAELGKVAQIPKTLLDQWTGSGSEAKGESSSGAKKDVSAAEVIADIALPRQVALELQDPMLQRWVDQCARMAYTILAINGFGLITASHHLRTQAEKAAEATMKMYDMYVIAKGLSIDAKLALLGIFHHSLHPIGYEQVAKWANSLPAGAVAKIANTVSIRLPAYPGGTTFIQRGITCLNGIRGAPAYTALLGKMEGAFQRLGVIDVQVRKNPLDYSQQFRPAQFEKHQAELRAVAKIVVMIFGLYDAWLNSPRDEEGPTKGVGMKGLISDNLGVYKQALEIGKGLLSAAKELTEEEFLAALDSFSVEASKAHVDSEDAESLAKDLKGKGRASEEEGEHS